MNAQLITASYSEAIQVDFTQDAWFNATAVASAFDKRPVDWLKLESTKEYISALASLIRSEETSLLKVKRGGRGKSDSTWFHPKLAIRFAQWLDVRFAVWCDLQIETILKGQAQAAPIPFPKTQKALPGGLTLEQQDAVKALVRSRVEVLPKAKQGKAAITCWSSIKSKFGVKTYKEVPPEQFGEVLSLVARLPLEGEHIPAGQPEPALPQSAPVWEGRVLLTFRNGVPVAARALDEDEITLRRPELAALWQGVIQDNMAAAARMALFCEAHSVSLPTAKA
jgi:hypothetical protein